MAATVTFRLAAHAEPVADVASLPPELRTLVGATGLSLLWHQVETFRALATHAVVTNTSATGTGKTLASQLHLLRDRPPKTVVVLAPTNALVDQHEADWRAFCEDASLPHHVIGLDARRLAAIELGDGTVRFNNARRLYEVLRNPQQVLGAAPGQPLVLVTNPDLFYLATFFQYGRTASKAAGAFLQRVDYLVIDELHYYSGLQLVAFFFVLALWHLTGRLPDGARVCLLTATPDDEVATLLATLAADGLTLGAVDPALAPPGLTLRPSLAPCDVELLTTDDRVTCVSDLVHRWLPHMHAGQDGAVLLDSLADVTSLAQRLGPRLAGRMRRITGPTPPDQRAAAERAPLIVATPTVDVGYNFRGREPDKRRQPLDHVIFDAPSRPRFWQRLGRAGRVLRAEQTDTPSTAVGLVPGDVLVALRTRGVPPELTRAELATLLDELGESFAERRVAPLLTEWAALGIAAPLAELRDTVADVNKPVVDALFDRIAGLFGSDHRTFAAYRAELRGVEEAREVARRGELNARSRLGWVRSLGQRIAEDRLPALRAKLQRHPDVARSLAREAVACYDAAMAFRGSGDLGVDVLAWDAVGLFADSPAWLSLSLEQLVRCADFRLADSAALQRIPAPPDAWGAPLQVIITAEATPRRTLLLQRQLSTGEKLANFCGVVAADHDFQVLATAQQPGRPIHRLPAEVVHALAERPLVYYIPRRSEELHDPHVGPYLRPVRFTFLDGARPVDRLGFVGQHAVVANALHRSRAHSRRTD